jgi:hypothetical protein
MATWLWIVIIVVVLAIAAAAVMAARRRRTMALRQRFGTEYDRTLDARDGQRAAEADLRDRERERGRLDIKPLSEVSRARYAGEWRAAQQSFVDQPEEATAAAYDLVNRVMAERGYPMRDFDARADLVSVDHPDVVENYRVAHGIHERAQHQQASTEDLREAMIRYRSLFEELLGADGDAAVPASTGPAGARHADEEPASPAPARPASDEPARSRTARDGEVSDDAR